MDVREPTAVRANRVSLRVNLQMNGRAARESETREKGIEILGWYFDQYEGEKAWVE